MKKILWGILFTGLLVGLGVKFIYPKQMAPINAIPSSAGVALYAEALETFYLFNKLDSLLPESSQVKYTLDILAELGWKSKLEKRPAAFVAERSAGLLIVDIGKLLNPEKIKQELTASGLIELVTHNYKGNEVHVGKKPFSISYAVFKNLLLLSREAIGVEAALEAVLDGNDRPNFGKKKHQGNLVVWIQPEYVKAIYSDVLTRRGEKEFEVFAKNYKSIILSTDDNKFLDWTGFLELKEEKAPISDQGFSKDDLLEILSYIPQGAGQFSIVRCDLNKIDQSKGGNEFSKYVLPWIDPEGAIIEFAGNALHQKYWAVKVNPEAIEVAKSALSSKRSDFYEDLSYGMFTITAVQDIEFLKPLGIESSGEIKAFTLIEEYIVFGKSRKDLEVLLDDYLVSNTKSKSENLLKRIGEQEEKVNGAWFAGGNALASLFKDNQLSQTYGDLQCTGFLSKYNKQNRSSGFNAFLDKEDGQAVKHWRTRLNGKAISAPFVYDDQIFILDERLLLYALNFSGEILWEKQLRASVIGKIQFRKIEEKSVLFFNTVSSINALDFSGNEWPGFPLNLSERATSSMTIVDFEHDQNFSFFVPCGKEIFAYESTGAPIIGWNPLVFSDSISYPFAHFQYGGKDYFYGVDNTPQLLVLDRWGEAIFPAIPIEDTIALPSYHQLDTNSDIPGINRIVTCNSNGKVLVVNLLGKFFGLRLEGKGEAFTQFIFSDFLGDIRKDYLTLSGNTLALNGYEELKFLNYFKAEYTSGDQVVFSITNSCAAKSEIGLFSKENELVYILKPDGTVLENFPLAATQPLNVAYFNECREKMYILVSGDEVYAVD